MRVLACTLALTAAVSGGALVERLADPFERHEHDYMLDGPPAHSETLYVSSNWYDDDGDKHDDRVGDVLIAITLVGSVGAAAIEGERRKRIATTSPATT